MSPQTLLHETHPPPGGSMPCPYCGGDNPAASAFCGHCGRALTAPLGTARTRAARRKPRRLRRALIFVCAPLLIAGGLLTAAYTGAFDPFGLGEALFRRGEPSGVIEPVPVTPPPSEAADSPVPPAPRGGPAGDGEENRALLLRCAVEASLTGRFDDGPPAGDALLRFLWRAVGLGGPYERFEETDGAVRVDGRQAEEILTEALGAASPVSGAYGERLVPLEDGGYLWRDGLALSLRVDILREEDSPDGRKTIDFNAMQVGSLYETLYGTYRAVLAENGDPIWFYERLVSLEDLPQGLITPARASASSEAADADGALRGAGLAIDGDAATAWLFSVPKEGEGTSVTLYFDAPRRLCGLRVVGGWFKDDKTALEYGQAENVRAEFSDGTSAEFTLQTLDHVTASQHQDFSLGRWVETEWVTLTVLSAYPGGKYKAVGLGEVAAF